ncbi:MAG: hypothetical protein AAF726_02395 [Planctomycetota bacterium]
MNGRIAALAVAATLGGCSSSVEATIGFQVVGATPGVVRAGDVDVAWIVAGTGFAAGATVSFDVADVTIEDVTVVGPNEITFLLTAPATLNAGTARLTVTGPEQEFDSITVSTSPEDVTLSGAVQPLFDTHCVGCHSGPVPGGALDLSIGLTHGSLVGVQSTGLPTMTLVQPGNADASYLIDKLSGTQTVGAPMPPTGPRLEPHEIALVVLWIEAGALDD